MRGDVDLLAKQQPRIEIDARDGSTGEGLDQVALHRAEPVLAPKIFGNALCNGIECLASFRALPSSDARVSNRVLPCPFPLAIVPISASTSRPVRAPFPAPSCVRRFDHPAVGDSIGVQPLRRGCCRPICALNPTTTSKGRQRANPAPPRALLGKQGPANLRLQLKNHNKIGPFGGECWEKTRSSKRRARLGGGAFRPPNNVFCAEQ